MSRKAKVLTWNGKDILAEMRELLAPHGAIIERARLQVRGIRSIALVAVLGGCAAWIMAIRSLCV